MILDFYQNGHTSLCHCGRMLHIKIFSIEKQVFLFVRQFVIYIKEHYLNIYNKRHAIHPLFWAYMYFLLLVKLFCDFPLIT